MSDHDGIASNLGLSLFLWETHLSGDDQPAFYFGLFDLNAWYQSQMPCRVTLEAQHQCPYFSICSLEDALQAASQSHSETTRKNDADIASLINIGIDLSSISRYQSLSSAEQHFFPSSLAFDMTCLFERGFVYASNLGLQRKVLLELQSTGREGLVEPQHLYKLCVISGLISDPSLDVDNVDFAGQRSLLLTVALENHLVSLLTGCIMHWKDGKNTFCFLLEQY